MDMGNCIKKDNEKMKIPKLVGLVVSADMLNFLDTCNQKVITITTQPNIRYIEHAQIH